MTQIEESFESQERQPEEKFNLKVELWEWMEAVVVSFVILIFIFAFFFRIVGISGSSMETTLMNENKVIVMSMFYTPAAGDVVSHQTAKRVWKTNHKTYYRYGKPNGGYQF